MSQVTESRRAIDGGGKRGGAGDPDAVAAIVAASGTSFALGMRVLPPKRRRAMFAVYAFCRIVDDIVDEPGEEADQRARLEGWRTELDHLYGEVLVPSDDPIARALAGPVRAFDLPKEEFLAIIDGMEMDLGSGVHISTMADLLLYCRRVAGAVGMLSVRIFGVSEAIGKELAVVQGEALQLTNILRDLVEDAALGRLYLPADLLRAHGIDSDDPSEVLAHPGLDAACREMAAYAHDRYRRTRQLLDQCDRRAVRASRLMMEIYRRILERLERRGWHDVTQEVGLGKAEKIWVFLRYGLL